MDDKFVANVSRWRTALLVLGAIGFVATGIGMVLYPRSGDAFPIVFGWAAILFFGLCGLIGIRQMFRSGPDIRIDGQGIWWRRWSDETIPWRAITGLYPAGVGRTPFLCLTLADPAAYPSTHMLGEFAGINRAMEFGDISISTTGTDRSFAELMAAIEHFAPRDLLFPPESPPGRPEL